MRVGGVVLLVLIRVHKGFFPRISKEGDCEYLVKLAIQDKIS